MIRWSSTVMEAALVIFILSACVKVLLFPSYKSTDFEVHRNWLAITHSLPLSKWYYEDTSQWTLDYPPFFAWFEWFLSQIAVHIDPAIVQVSNLDYSSISCVYFQRASVILTEGILCYATIEYCRYREGTSIAKRDLVQFVLSFQLLANFGLLIIDHIHFQYNGFLFGILVLSITRIIQGRHLEGAIWFACLLNLKHIFLYIAPAYFVYLLKHYCFTNSEQIKVGRPNSLSQFRWDRFLLLGALVVTVFIASFGPFITMGQLQQVLARLFPFKRGLCHAYWAPNAWALYNIIDKTLAMTASHVGLSSLVATNSSMTSGLIGEMTHQLLPSVPPIATLTLTLLAMAPALWRLWFSNSTAQDFIKTVVLCAYSCFMFGWHVHEKAIMMITIPMSLLALENKHFTRVYLLVSTAGHISLFPLLFTSAETLIKVILYILFTATSFLTLPLLIKDVDKKHDKPVKQRGAILLPPTLTLLDTLLLGTVLLLQVYCIFGSEGIILAMFPFLPLLVTSCSCAVVIVWSWLLMN